jgi:hypothetical protein
MPATLRTLKATVGPDGVVHLLQPLDLDGPAEAVVTVLVPSREPNAVTMAALQENLEELPRFKNVDDLLQDLER